MRGPHFIPVFKNLSKSVGNLIKNLKSALSASPDHEDPQAAPPVRKHDKKRRRQRHPGDEAYIRRADSRPAPADRGEKSEKSDKQQQPRKQ